ncbi:MAG: DNA mismatch repair endonuclease MutL, partial [Anaerolineales bacterium]|nr:DNA mismatch repair endonuclease MutL [Anaerolineales bacterium]
MPIRVLSEDVASAIAAGEVVERPESVVKELVENAIDASAKRIEINIEGGGRRLIEVADDGCGIRADEVPLAVAHHATSKLSTKDDLFQIETLGFRGEALTSIGAVSRMEILTRSTKEEVGTKLTVTGGHIDEPVPIGAPSGTVVRIRDLFFNMPARLKFLKSETTERRRISTLISRYAIAYPQIAFKLVQEGREGLSTTGSGNRTEVLAAVFGLDTAKSMICLPEGGDGKIQVNGYISPPSVHRSNRREITFFVRGRWIQDP